MNNPLFYMAARLCYHLPFLQFFARSMKFRAWRRIRAAWATCAYRLREGERVLPLDLWRKNMGFYVPLRDKSWSDEAVVELRYLSSTQP